MYGHIDRGNFIRKHSSVWPDDGVKRGPNFSKRYIPKKYLYQTVIAKIDAF